MSHPDDAAEAIDPAMIDILINNSAPEKAAAWRQLRERHGITFHRIADRKGVTFWAQGHRIEFTDKTMTWLWLLGFAGWRAFRLHGPHLFWRQLTGATVDKKLQASDPTYAEAEGDYEAVLYAVRDFPELESVDDDGFWPEGIPRPQQDKQGLDIEQQAAFDLVMIATAYMLLHETRHVMYTAAGSRPSAPEEELECDAFARQFLLDGVAQYAEAPPTIADEAVLAKRAAGIALGAYAIYEFTPESHRRGTENYPPIADRLEALFPAIVLPADHWFWDFAASLLIGASASRDSAAVIPDLFGIELCRKLADQLRIRHQQG